MGVELIGRTIVFNDTQANVEANAAVLGEICFAKRTEDDILGFSLDGGGTWYWIVPGTGNVIGNGSGTTGHMAVFDGDINHIKDGGLPPTGSSGASAFTDLTDTFASYSGLSGTFVRVKGTEDGLETAMPVGSGDVVAPGSATPGNLAVFGADPQHIVDGGAVPTGGLSTGTSSYLTGDVTMTNNSSYYDGPSITLSAGIWLVTGSLSFIGSAGGLSIFTVRLWDGTNIFGESEVNAPANSYGAGSVTSIISLGSPTSIKVSATCNQNTAYIDATAVVSGTANKASWIHAIKVS